MHPERERDGHKAVGKFSIFLPFFDLSVSIIHQINPYNLMSVTKRMPVELMYL